MESKTGKRIVSREEYAALDNKRIGLASSGISLCIVAVVMALVAVFCLSCAVSGMGTNAASDSSLAGFCWLMFACSAGATYLCGRGGKRNIEQAGRMDMESIVPVHTNDLPAPDSLVRPSSEPQQAQEAVLLRAATQGVETPSEQLVRASAGQK